MPPSCTGYLHCMYFHVESVLATKLLQVASMSEGVKESSFRGIPHDWNFALPDTVHRIFGIAYI
eukprot:CAMPEP_0169068488 /NCGR_PEP_ID=MMETSP1015-20121227/4042_1 /TAXON_ID=342587 /ORGANISM="Karlodinium micrum, Strain CCMP2283" /LENGTH=63 /DNA_ID=CAMNT_0009127289 /DNA_START=284 /DNA_END=475 /DNA_ORIENTATION=+